MLDVLDNDLNIMLQTLKVNYKKLDIFKSLAIVYELQYFGTLVVGLNRQDYGQISTTLNNRFEDYRIIYITPEDLILEKKEELFWELARSGYITYLRVKYPRQFNEAVRLQNLDKRIINKRLEIWGDKAKYKWLVEENKQALNESATYILSLNPSFYDYIPE